MVKEVGICQKGTAHTPIEARQQKRTGYRLELWKHDKGVECILLQRGQDVSHGFLLAFVKSTGCEQAGWRQNEVCRTDHRCPR
jgi:hypothetical protein